MKSEANSFQDSENDMKQIKGWSLIDDTAAGDPHGKTHVIQPINTNKYLIIHNRFNPILWCANGAH